MFINPNNSFDGILSEAKIPEVQTVDDALRLFGLENTDNLTEDGLKKIYRKLSLKFHPDASEDADATEDFKILSRAYEILKRYIRNPRTYKDNPSSPRSSRPSREDIPEWAWAGWHGGMPPGYTRINREDYTDLNFILKTMWEKSDHSQTKWTVWNFDGRFFRGVFTVFGNESILKDMAEAMLTWDKYNRSYAIFAQKQNSNDNHLIYLDGTYLNGGSIFSINNQERNNENFRRELFSFLESIKENVPRS